jgi:lipopolysaccharide transport system ATP-binding protein
MSDTVISVESLSKSYFVGHEGPRERYHSLRDSLVRHGKNYVRKAVDMARGRQIIQGDSVEEFWALKDVSFEVKRGEVLGIIGRNGAGKSTLLKILSRITSPTLGRITLNGRVASLLEVGTGFHPELTGRENIFLNGAILGMRKSEIRRKFDEIVEFSGVEKFIDTPVKRYSSGMYVRLAFAVPAHLEPEILVLDEVLAVGDAEFQKKCLGKMKDVAGHGRTVIFVSHNMAAVRNLCSSAFMLKNGTVALKGSVVDVTGHYLSAGVESTGYRVWDDGDKAPGNERVRLKRVQVTVAGSATGDVMLNKPFQVEIEYTNLCDGLSLNASIHLLDKMGVEVLASANFPSLNLGSDMWVGKKLPVGTFRSICTLPAYFLNEGCYSIRVALVSNNSMMELMTSEILSFNTHDTGEMTKDYVGHWIGCVKPKLDWTTRPLEDTNVLNPL